MKPFNWVAPHSVQMQERYDFGSAKHRSAYERWKKRILARCEELEKEGGGGDVMVAG